MYKASAATANVENTKAACLRDFQLPGFHEIRDDEAKLRSEGLTEIKISPKGDSVYPRLRRRDLLMP